MEEFKKRINQHIEHIKKVGEHCATEETTKQALILPLLDILGFSPYNPMRVKAEYRADFPGVKATERVDYALFSAGLPVIFIEAKAYAENLTNHCPQLSRYYNATPEVTVSAITNGREWRFFTDLVNRNIMDSEPFLTINFEEPEEDARMRTLRFSLNNGAAFGKTNPAASSTARRTMTCLAVVIILQYTDKLLLFRSSPCIQSPIRGHTLSHTPTSDTPSPMQC